MPKETESTDLIKYKLPFSRLVHEITQIHAQGFRYQAFALDTLQKPLRRI
jgi:hypothetical protein